MLREARRRPRVPGEADGSPREFVAEPCLDVAPELARLLSAQRPPRSSSQFVEPGRVGGGLVGRRGRLETRQEIRRKSSPLALRQGQGFLADRVDRHGTKGNSEEVRGGALALVATRAQNGWGGNWRSSTPHRRKRSVALAYFGVGWLAGGALMLGLIRLAT